jgi:NADH dehydrogenase
LGDAILREIARFFKGKNYMVYTKVIIVGGGFGGLNAAKSLKKAKMEVLLLDKTNHHLFQPLLYQVATAALSPGEIAIPIREILRDQENATVMMGDVINIDKNKKAITLGNGETIAYDYLVVATGARHSYFGNDQWERFAPGLKTISDALNIRQDVLLSFEKAERLDSISEAEKYLNFVVIGGGPTGVEMAGAIAEVAHKTMFKNFRRIKPQRSKIFLVEALPNILSSYPERLSKRAVSDLEKMGVRVMTEKKVTNITEDGVEIGGVFIPCSNVIWAAGNQASPLLKTLETPLDRQGRVIVDKDMSIPDHPEIFVIGDAAHFEDKEGKPLPAIAPAAVQQARFVAKIIRKEIPKEKRKTFKYLDKGSMATIGKTKAVATMGKLQFTGLMAWLAWCFIHIVYLIGFRNRFGVMVEWFYCFFTGQRGVRLIYKSIEDNLPSAKNR